MRVNINDAASQLNQGKVVAIPTETVYGLAASIAFPEAVEQIFELKGRPRQNPLIMHVASVEEIYPFLLDIPDSFHLLAKHFWPGPLTLVLPVKKESVHKSVRANLDTQAFRIPEHPTARLLLEKTGPLVAPSANLSGKPSAVLPEHVEDDFGASFPVLDGGECQRGVESTILIWQDGWWLGRMGAIPVDTFTSLLGYEPKMLIDSKLRCPGQLYRHYAPHAALILDGDFEKASFILGFSDRLYPEAAEVLRLGSSLEPQKVLKNLFSALRYLDERKVQVAYIDTNVPFEGLWLTFLERIKKASFIN